MLKESPNIRMTQNVAMREKGMAMTTMRVERRSWRKNSRTSAVRPTLKKTLKKVSMTESRTNVAPSETTRRWTCPPRSFSMPGRAALTLLTTETVLAEGFLRILRRTASLLRMPEALSKNMIRSRTSL